MNNKKSQTSFNGPGPVEKLQFLAMVASLKDLNRADIALLITVANMINARTGIAWPSFKTLAARSGCSDRHAKSTVKRLVERNLLRIVTHGNKIRSNRYAINLCPTNLSTNLCSDAENTSLVMHGNSSSDSRAQLDVMHTSHQPIHQPAHKAREGMDTSFEVDATPPGAEGPSGLHQTGADKFPEFWSAFPWRARVAEAEQHMTELIHDGVPYSEILDGAVRYSNYCDATAGLRRSDALSWLQKQRWRDSWMPPQKKGDRRSPTSKKTTETKPCSSSLAAKKTMVNPEFKEWKEKRKVLWNSLEKIHDDMEQHIGTVEKTACKDCHSYTNKPLSALCSYGQKKVAEAEQIKMKLKAFAALRPPQTIRIKNR